MPAAVPTALRTLAFHSSAPAFEALGGGLGGSGVLVRPSEKNHPDPLIRFQRLGKAAAWRSFSIQKPSDLAGGEARRLPNWGVLRTLSS